MTTILHIQSSSNLKSSVSRQIGNFTIEALKTSHPGAHIIERDLVKTHIPHISPRMIEVFYTEGAQELAFADELVSEVLAADILVVEAPMYNFSIPSVLKAWIDHIVRKGKTFHYTANGPEGLAKGKKTILILGRGGVYSHGPAHSMDHQESYLRFILGFIGITDIESVYIEGVGMGPEKLAEALAGAEKQVTDISRKAA